MNYFYKQPEYFSKFVCLGGDCPLSCCDGWRVDWTDSELRHLKQANMSEALRERVEQCFTSLEDGNSCIELCDDGRCPFHNRETDLCDIQKEIGEKYFGVTCKNYPRRYYRRDSIIYRSCSSSCPAVVMHLINNKDAARYNTFLSRNIDTIPENIVKTDTVQMVSCYPYLKYKPQILDFYVDLFIRDVKIENLIILGALAAKKISAASDGNKADHIPDILKEYKKQSTNSEILKSVDEIHANYKLKYLIVNNLIYDNFGVRKGEIDISKLHDGEQLIEENYMYGMERLQKAFESRNYFMNNISINMFSDIFLHLEGEILPFWDLYSYFVACVSVMQVFSCAVGLESDDPESSLIKIISVLNRLISHNAARKISVLDYLKTNGIVSPAHLALILK